MIDLAELDRVSASRAARWHAGKPWSLLEWAGAMAGEAGEAANFAKKVKRLDDDIASIDHRDGSLSREQYIECTMKEAADALLYAVCVIRQAGGNVEEVVRNVFNNKSVEYGFPERI